MQRCLHLVISQSNLVLRRKPQFETTQLHSQFNYRVVNFPHRRLSPCLGVVVLESDLMTTKRCVKDVKCRSSRIEKIAQVFNIRKLSLVIEPELKAITLGAYSLTIALRLGKQLSIQPTTTCYRRYSNDEQRSNKGKDRTCLVGLGCACSSAASDDYEHYRATYATTRRLMAVQVTHQTNRRSPIGR